MKLRLLYFGIVRERLGRREETRECRDGITVAQLLEELARAHDIFALGAGSLRIAVNREYVESSQVLGDNDEVAVIPPVAGGADGSPPPGFRPQAQHARRFPPQAREHRFKQRARQRRFS